MPDPDIFIEKLDAIQQELRRQGRASIAAQSASESCMEAVERLRDALDERTEVRSDTDVVDLLRAITPVIDSIDRIADQADRLARQCTPPSRLARLFGAQDASPSLRALADGMTVLKAQLEQALGHAGVEVDREANVPVDAERHRVVEVRPTQPGVPAETVVQVLRPGLWVGDHCVREADVASTPCGQEGEERE